MQPTLECVPLSCCYGYSVTNPVVTDGKGNKGERTDLDIKVVPMTLSLSMRKRRVDQDGTCLVYSRTK